MAFLWAGPDLLSAGAFSQEHGLYFAGGITFGSVVTEKANQQAPPTSDRSFCYHGDRHGAARCLVGTLPSGYQPSRFYVPGPNGAGSRRKSGCLVLLKQTHLAGRPDLHLSKMDDLIDASGELHLVAGRNWLVRSDLLFETVCGAQR